MRRYISIGAMDALCSLGLVLQFILFYPLSAPLVAYDERSQIPICWYQELGYDAHVQAWYASREYPQLLAQ